MNDSDTMKPEVEWRAALRRQFPELAERHRPRIYRVCLRIVGDPQRAEDLTQDTLVTALSKLDGFEGRSAFGTWICGIGKHLSLNAVRKRGEYLADDGVLDPKDAGLSTLSQLRRHEREELMRQASLELLTPHEQEVVYLRYTEEMPRARIAQILGMEDVNAVRTTLVRCRRRLEKGLRRRLEQLDEGTSFIRPSWS